MVELIGSEKQIVWAEEIRAEFIPQAEKALSEVRESLAKAEAAGKPEAFIASRKRGVANREAALAALQAIPWAKWWIEHRGTAQHASEKASLIAYSTWVCSDIISINKDEAKFFAEVRKVYPNATDEELRA